MPDLIRHPEVIEFTEFPPSLEWEKLVISDFLRETPPSVQIPLSGSDRSKLLLLYPYLSEGRILIVSAISVIL